MNDRKQEIKVLEKLFDKTLKLISLYKKHDLTIPFTLKGNLGEFIVVIELLKRFPKHQIDYRGGAFPGTDVSVDDIKIQVKTQFKQEPKKYKWGGFDYEGSPTIKKDTLDKKKCDVLILIILYLNNSCSKIEKQNVYIFEGKEFKYFNTKGCWSGNSKGDYTIKNILSVNGKPSGKIKEEIDFYNTTTYKNLFKKSQDAWSKIQDLI